MSQKFITCCRKKNLTGLMRLGYNNDDDEDNDDCDKNDTTWKPLLHDPRFIYLA